MTEMEAAYSSSGELSPPGSQALATRRGGSTGSASMKRDGAAANSHSKRHKLSRHSPRCVEELFQASEGAEVAAARYRGVDVEHQGRLLVGEFFEVS